MKTTRDLSRLPWQVSGWTPYSWRFLQSMETGSTSQAEIPAVPAPVPGSVQAALREANLLPDWNVGLNARACEWVENRHWIYQTTLPDDWINEEGTTLLRCLGLDYAGTVLLNGNEVGAFRGSFVPHVFDLTPHLAPAGNRLQIVFEDLPRWLGQFGYTSRMTEWKPRFNYTWDWTARLVQIGIWDAITLEVTDGAELDDIRCTAAADANGRGTLVVRGTARGEAAHAVSVALLDSNGVAIRAGGVSPGEFSLLGMTFDNVPVALWHPHGQGDQPLYTVQIELLDREMEVRDAATRRVGFKQIVWEPCAGAPPEADPWICVVNGVPTFLQGVNWTPIRPNFADVTEDEYRQRLELYRDLGCNLLRVWGGAFLEKSCFYDRCDELGLLVWQEFPLSSSGVDNWPPEDPASIEAMAEIARSYIARRQHHVSLLLWCGGNELQGGLDGSKQGIGKPSDSSHPLLARLSKIVAEEDPERRFLPASSSGPRFGADEKEFGQGLHWDVHGPWRAEGDLGDAWTRYWSGDDALFRSETGAPGASPADILRHYRGDLPELPGTLENPLWRRTPWWIEWPRFVDEHDREPRSLEEYVAWSQQRQRDALMIAARACKGRFPRCGGFVVWMGHDSFPCAANTAIVDFWGRPKSAALGLAEVFREAARRG